VPVSLSGVANVGGKGLLRARAGRIRLTVHPPVPTAGVDDDHLDGLVETVRAAIVRGCRGGGTDSAFV
jgi:hypothetical protein